MKNWIDYIDSEGRVVQKLSLGGDGGDSLNRTAAVYVLEHLTHESTGACNLSSLTDGRGKWRRSTHPDKWYSDWDRTSRDQLTPITILLGFYKTNGVSLELNFRDHLKRGLLFTYNTRRNHVYKTQEDHVRLSTPDVPWDYSWKLPDFTGPEFWALYIRGFNCISLYPILFLCDLHTLLGSIAIRFNKQDDVINHALILEYAKVQLDTPVMKLARWITPRKLIQARLDQFFGKEIEPPINELYRKLK